MNIQKILNKAKINVVAEYDDLAVRGNAMASGDDELDRKVEDEIIDRLERGDVWAWADVKVTATFGELTGESHGMCGCSYENERDFRASSGYFDDMRQEALEDLAHKLREIEEAGK